MTSFGESHGAGLGVVLDGVPAGVTWHEAVLTEELARRRPGAHGTASDGVVSARQESDVPEVLSGVFQGKTLGTPIAILVRNSDARSQDYAQIASQPRAGHADDVWREKFGHSDPRGGGRSSGRETVSRVMAGSVAQMLLRELAPGLRVYGFASQVGPLKMKQQDYLEIKKRFQVPHPPAGGSYFDGFVARFPSPAQSVQAEEMLKKAVEDGKSHGGIAQIWVENPPAGLGQPVFSKLKSDLASALMGVGATSGVEVGDGFLAAQAEGTEFHQNKPGGYGGIRGGISTGERITIKVAFKPTSSVLDVAKQGRHDPCIVTRAIPVLEAMVNWVLADHLLWTRQDRLFPKGSP